MKVDDFAPNFSFFFSNGLDAEYNVIGRVARRIWAIALRDRYGADERSQKLKYHVQTSGRSLHAQEMAFNDIRTTLQALLALFDHCNSLHTNAYDEAVTTPTEESVRRALAIQLIIQRELGLSQNENPIQGVVRDRRADRPGRRGGARRVRSAVGARRRARRDGDAVPAQRRSRKRACTTSRASTRAAADHRRQHLREPDAPGAAPARRELVRALGSGEARTSTACARSRRATPSTRPPRSRSCARPPTGGNVFGALLETVKHASLGQISDTLFRVGGAYRRAM